MMWRANRSVILCACGLVLVLLYFYQSGSFSKWTSSEGAASSHVSLRKLLIAGIAAAEMGGSEVRRVRLSNELSEKSKGKTKEGANDPLTDGDLSSHRVIYYGLAKAFPDLYIVSEEHDAAGSSVVPDLLHVTPDSIKGVTLDDVAVPRERVAVWIDPLDATQEYTENLLEYVTTMVCVAVDGSPVIGIIHKPFLNQTVWSWVGHGTTPGMVVAPESGKGHMQVIVSRSHAGKVEAIAKRAFGASAQVIPAGGAGYKVLEVVSGKADMYLHSSFIKKWDVCAGDALLRALGGRMSTLEGDDLQYGRGDSPAAPKGILAALHNHSTYLAQFHRAMA